MSAGSDQKGPEAYRTISEVASDLDLPQHVLRFWETRFGQIKPMKRAGGRRFYRPQDVDLLRGIRHLLYSEGLTIRGVQKVLREQGPKHVSAIGRGEADAAAPVAAPPPKLKPAKFRETKDEAQAFFPFADVPSEEPEPGAGPQPRPAMLKPVDDDFDDEDATPTAYAKRRREAPAVKAPPEEPAARPRPEPAAPKQPPRLRPEPKPDETDRAFSGEEHLPKGILPEDAVPADEPESHHSGFRFLDRLKREPHQPRPASGEGSLSREDVRDLQAALFELLECKRLLDRTR